MIIPPDVLSSRKLVGWDCKMLKFHKAYIFLWAYNHGLIMRLMMAGFERPVL